MEALGAGLLALAGALFTATRMKRDFDRDYVEDLEKDNGRLEKEKEGWKQRALMAEEELRDRRSGGQPRKD